VLALTLIPMASSPPDLMLVSTISSPLSRHSLSSASGDNKRGSTVPAEFYISMLKLISLPYSVFCGCGEMIVKDERYICITALRLIKKSMKYSDLQEVLGIPAPVLWRYIAGMVRPTRERASEILRTLVERGVLRRVISKRLRFVDGDVVDMYSLVYSTDVLWLASIEAYYHFKELQIDTALTTEVDGIPVGLAIASMMDLDLVVAKRRKELGFSEFYEETYLSRDPPSLVTLYVPKTSLGKGSRVLIVDDLLRSGRTLRALVNIVRQARAEVAGIFSLVAVGNEWKEVVKDLDVRIVVLVSR